MVRIADLQNRESGKNLRKFVNGRLTFAKFQQ